DIANADQMDELMTEHQFYVVINFAAESHVDRSINSPQNFIHTNVIGTSVLLDCARRHGVQRFIQISTDEVYGSLGDTGKFTEQSPLDPSSPYSSSKAGADLLALASHKTYGQEVIVTRCSNNYGRYQFPEKLIPLMIIKALRDEALPVYGDGMNVRDWIHVDDHCAGIVAALFEGKPGAIYNFGGGREMVNLEVVKLILKKLGKPETLISFVTDRLGHDRPGLPRRSRAKAGGTAALFDRRLAPGGDTATKMQVHLRWAPFCRSERSRGISKFFRRGIARDVSTFARHDSVAKARACALARGISLNSSGDLCLS